MTAFHDRNPEKDETMTTHRREFIKRLAIATIGGALYGCTRGYRANGHVVVVGGGYGGATAAKYLRLWSQGTLDVTLIERNDQFVSCPLSNLVVSGDRRLADLTLTYDGLAKHGIRVLHDEVTAIDAEGHSLRLRAGARIRYDRLIVSPGIDFLYEQLPALDNAEAQQQILHAWKAGPQTIALRQQLEEMRDGGVFVMTVPKAPYRCPPGPYERASLVAAYFKQVKPRSKVIVLDANDDIVSKKTLFTKAWSELYANLIDYRPNSELRDVEIRSRTAILDFDKVRADVLNVIPGQRAGDLIRSSGLRLVNERWAEVDWRSMASTSHPTIHVLGDAVFAAPAMPKSAHMANQHGKLAAAAILELLAGDSPSPTPLLTNTCYSFIDAKNAIHIASVHRYDAQQQTMLPVQGSGGLSPARSELEAAIAVGWARNVWMDTLG